jgi:hypothetical protein
VEKYNLYIACYRQLFQVFKQESRFSYKLSSEQHEKLVNFFSNADIPYSTEFDSLEELDGDLVEVEAPCNSRVVFTIDSENYNVLSFNSYLMKNFFAEKISKSLLAKGIKSKVELIGSHSNQPGEIISITRQIEKPVILSSLCSVFNKLYHFVFWFEFNRKEISDMLDQAIQKIKTEMEADTGSYTQAVGGFLLQHLNTNPESAEKILAPDKTIAKSLLEMKKVAKTKAVNGCGVLTDAEGFEIVLKYFGLDAAVKKSGIDIKLEDLL